MGSPKENSGDTDDKSIDTKGKRGFMRIFEGVGQTWLALLIVVPAFILIFYMLSIQQGTNSQALTRIAGLNGSVDATQIDSLTGFYREVFESNQNMFALMTTVFGAWVGAVVAFYFGAKNLAQAQGSIDKIQQSQGEAIKRALSPQEKLSSTTVEQLLNENPTAKNVITVTMKKTIGEIRKIFTDNQDITNVLVVDTQNTQKPLGLLYKNDLEQLQTQNETPDAINGKLLEERIENIKRDFVINKPWSKATGVKNYATLSLTDNLQIAQSAMLQIAEGPKVRGIVLEQGKIVGIVDYTMISAVLQKE
jgi:CBS domain